MTIDIIHTEELGRKIVTVSLTNCDQRAILYEEDWDVLMDLGVSPYWKLAQGGVKAENLSVSRLIVDADRGQKVQFFDRNPTNLRRENLVKARGGGLFRARDQIARTHRFHKPELKHIVETSDEKAGGVMN